METAVRVSRYVAASACRGAHMLEHKGAAVGLTRAQRFGRGVCGVALAKPLSERSASNGQGSSAIVRYSPELLVQQTLNKVPVLRCKWFDGGESNPSAEVLDSPKDILKIPRANLKYVIDNKGGLWIGKKGTNHIDIVDRIAKWGGYPVAAGKLKTDENGHISEYNNQSGHFQPESTFDRIALVENVFAHVFGDEAHSLYQAYFGFTLSDGASGYIRISMGDEGERQIAELSAKKAEVVVTYRKIEESVKESLEKSMEEWNGAALRNVDAVPIPVELIDFSPKMAVQMAH